MMYKYCKIHIQVTNSEGVKDLWFFGTPNAITDTHLGFLDQFNKQHFFNKAYIVQLSQKEEQSLNNS